ncbi:hypothetical protein PHMEG_00032801, partial [Phytophthora megakarya]
ESELVVTSPSSDTILKEIIKNRLAFSIRLARLVHQKSTLLVEFAWTHLWPRCIDASVLNASRTNQMTRHRCDESIALSGAHVPWLLASGTRLLHPNTLTAILRSQCGYTIWRELGR